MCLVQLPWATANEDLVELFETTGQVVLAEVLFDGGRAKGMGIVQFKEIDEATEACTKFTGYVYGGRPLGESEPSLIVVSVDRQVTPQSFNTPSHSTLLARPLQLVVPLHLPRKERFVVLPQPTKKMHPIRSPFSKDDGVGC